MNFKKVLLEKNLKIEELPVKLQKKITELGARAIRTGKCASYF
jgi:hypothetical protein